MSCNSSCAPGCIVLPACPSVPTPTPVPPVSLAAYGGVINGLDTFQPRPGGTTTALSALNQAMPGKNVTVAPGALTIRQSGVYQVTYASSYSYSTNSYMQFFVTRNGVPIAETVTARDAVARQVENAAQTALVQLHAGDVLQLAIRPNNAGDLYLPADSTKLLVTKIS
jgi:hypothetical protein